MKRILLVFALFFAQLAAFYGDNNIKNAQNVFAAFEIPTSYQADLALFRQFSEQTAGEEWEHFAASFERGYEYIPILRQMLIDAEIPPEFLYLAMIESRFNTRAYSKRKAAGIWQIIPSTAKSLGLKIDDFIDERRDPIKSTQAAIAYLKQLKAQTGKWYLAAMAYNCGIGRLKRAIKEAGSDDIEILINYIPPETRRYIRSILSVSVAFSDIGVLKTQDKEHFLNRGATITLASVQIPAGTDFASIAKGANLDLETLKSYNRQYRYNFIPPIGRDFYDVYLPYDNLLAFRQHFKPQKIDFSKLYFVYYVQKGDSLYSISRRFRVSIETLKNTNNIQKSLLSINQKLVIPLKSANFAYNAKAQ